MRKMRIFGFFIFDRFVLFAFVKNFLMALSFFLAVYFFSNLLTELPSLLKRAEYNPFVTFENVMLNFIYKIPDYFFTVYPFAYLFSTAYILGSFYKNNEIIAIITAGWSMRRISIGIVLLGIVSSFFLIFLNNDFIPHYNYKSAIMEQELYKENKNQNVDNMQTYGEDGILYFASYYNSRSKSFSSFLILKTRPGVKLSFQTKQNIDIRALNNLPASVQIQKIIESNLQASIDFPFFWMVKGRELVYEEATGQWIIRNGFKWEWDKNGNIIKTESLQNSALDIKEKPEYFAKETRNIKEMSVAEVENYLEKLKKSKQPFEKDLVEFYSEKYAKPFSVFILALLSSALGKFFSRKHLLIMTLVFSFVIAVFYYVVINIGISLGKEGVLPPLFSAFLGNLIGIGAYFYIKKRQLT